MTFFYWLGFFINHDKVYIPNSFKFIVSFLYCVNFPYLYTQQLMNFSFYMLPRNIFWNLCYWLYFHHHPFGFVLYVYSFKLDNKLSWTIHLLFRKGIYIFETIYILSYWKTYCDEYSESNYIYKYKCLGSLLYKFFIRNRSLFYCPVVNEFNNLT